MDFEHWFALTSLADPVVVLPMAFVTAVCLAFFAGVRHAATWCLAMCSGLGSVLAAKLLLLPYGLSPSGHTANAAAVYGGLLAVAAPPRCRPATAFAGATALIAFIVAIAASRIAILAHTWTETAMGAAMGLAAPSILIAFRRHSTERVLPVALLVLPLCAGLWFLGGTADLEPVIRDASLSIFGALSR